jgi:acetyl-CoA carboxylase carboxyl transferase subunit alpha
MADKDRSMDEIRRTIEELKALSDKDGVDLSEEIERLEAKLSALGDDDREETEPEVETNPDWEVVKLARHPKRPSTTDYLERVADDYYELRGDRMYADDRAIMTALARLGERTVVVIGHQKGHTAEENRSRNFGMPHPEGYRKAGRAMRLAERFGFPVVCLVDTPGAYPGIGAEERNIGGALAETIYAMFKLRVPIVVTVLGEGGSGGALGIGVGDRVLMMENAIYSVISPEGCAAIIWRDRAMAPEAARALKITADHLVDFGVVDEVVPEPAGGAHHDPDQAARSLKSVLCRHLGELDETSVDAMQASRRTRFQAIGRYEELSEAVEAASGGGG